MNDSSSAPTSFLSGRYQVRRRLGEGATKVVYLTHDNTFERDVAFALLKERAIGDNQSVIAKREAIAVGRLGEHSRIVNYL